MAKRKSVCLKCGQFKGEALTACPACGFSPKADRDVACSLLLTEPFDLGELVVGRSLDELKEASHLIQSGKEFQYNESEVTQLSQMYTAYRAVPTKQIVIDLIRWLGPAIVGIAVALWLWIR